MVQTWMSDRATGVHLLDVFREPHDGDTWICRRDPSIRRPYTDVIKTTEDGIPYVVPEVVLLFKAKHTREKDEADFRRALPLLDASRRTWLRESLDRCPSRTHLAGRPGLRTRQTPVRGDPPNPRPRRAGVFGVPAAQ